MQLETSEAACDRHQTKVVDLEEQLRAREASDQGVQERVKQLEAQLASLDKTYSKLKDQYNELREQYNSRQQEFDEKVCYSERLCGRDTQPFCRW